MWGGEKGGVGRGLGGEEEGENADLILKINTKMFHTTSENKLKV